MTTAARSIGPLDKVSIALGLSAGSHTGDETRTGFIYGLGVDGITPFEKHLFGKSVGDRLDLPVFTGCPEDFFGHLAGVLFERKPPPRPPFDLKVTVLGIEKADNRDVIQAMARMTGECGGGCDCGCGSH